MNKQEKDLIAQSLKNECTFLLNVARIFDERDSDDLPPEMKAQNKIIYEGLMKIRSRIAEEYEAVELGGIDE